MWPDKSIANRSFGTISDALTLPILDSSKSVYKAINLFRFVLIGKSNKNDAQPLEIKQEKKKEQWLRKGECYYSPHRNIYVT